MSTIFNKIGKYWPSNTYLVWLLVVYVITCFFSAHYLYSWDSGQFALATKYFSLTFHQPHPPGYPLFIFSGELVNFIFGNLNFSFLFLNWVAGAVSVLFLWRLLLTVKISRRGSFATVLLWVVNPVFWFNHNVALSYTFEAMAVIVSGYLLARSLLEKRASWLLANAVFSGIMIGFRPSMAVVLLVILITHAFIIRQDENRQWLLSAVLFSLAVLCWFLPFLKLVGVDNLFQILSGQIMSLPATWRHPSQLRFYGASTFFGVNLTILVWLFIGKWGRYLRLLKLDVFVPVFFISISFYLFGHFGNVAYVLSFLPIWLILIAPGIDWLVARPKGGVLVAVMVLIGVILFFQPVNFLHQKEVELTNYPSIREHDLRLQRYIEVATEAAVENDVIIVLLRGEYFDQNKEVKRYPYDDIRVLSYYVPQAAIYDLLGVRDVYFTAQDYFYSQFSGRVIIFPQETTRMFALADYLHPDVWPKGLIVVSAPIMERVDNVYEFAINDVRQFSFDGLVFIRGN